MDEFIALLELLGWEESLAPSSTAVVSYVKSKMRVSFYGTTRCIIWFSYGDDGSAFDVGEGLQFFKENYSEQHLT